MGTDHARWLGRLLGTDLRSQENSRVTLGTDLRMLLFSGVQGSAFPGAKWSCYNTGVRSAFIARLRGKIPAGTPFQDHAVLRATAPRPYWAGPISPPHSPPFLL